MAKKAIIEVLLIPESRSRSPEEIKDEILREFQEGFLRIPYCESIEKVKIVEE